MKHIAFWFALLVCLSAFGQTNSLPTPVPNLKLTRGNANGNGLGFTNLANVVATGRVTAASFSGDGSLLTGVAPNSNAIISAIGQPMYPAAFTSQAVVNLIGQPLYTVTSNAVVAAVGQPFYASQFTSGAVVSLIGQPYYASDFAAAFTSNSIVAKIGQPFYPAQFTSQSVVNLIGQPFYSSQFTSGAVVSLIGQPMYAPQVNTLLSGYASLAAANAFASNQSMPGLTLTNAYSNYWVESVGPTGAIFASGTVGETNISFDDTDVTGYLATGQVVQIRGEVYTLSTINVDQGTVTTPIGADVSASLIYTQAVAVIEPRITFPTGFQTVAFSNTAAQLSGIYGFTPAAEGSITQGIVTLLGGTPNVTITTNGTERTISVSEPAAPVQSVNGQTGAVVFPIVTSFNGQTGAVVQPIVTSVNGSTGAVTGILTTGSVFAGGNVTGTGTNLSVSNGASITNIPLTALQNMPATNGANVLYYFVVTNYATEVNIPFPQTHRNATLYSAIANGTLNPAAGFDICYGTFNSLTNNNDCKVEDIYSSGGVYQESLAATNGIYCAGVSGGGWTPRPYSYGVAKIANYTNIMQHGIAFHIFGHHTKNGNGAQYHSGAGICTNATPFAVTNLFIRPRYGTPMTNGSWFLLIGE